jgi:hypothetical protein
LVYEVNAAVVVLTTGQVFTQAVADGMPARSPFTNVELPPERQHEEMHFLDADQVNGQLTVTTIELDGPVWQPRAFRMAV